MGHRDDGHDDAYQPADLGREHAARVDDELGPDLGSLALVLHGDAGHATALRADGHDPGGGPDGRATSARPGRQRLGQPGWIQPAVGGQPHATEHAVGGHQREAVLRLARGDEVHGQAEGLGPAGLALELLHACPGRRQADRADLVPRRIDTGLGGQPPVQRGAVHHHLGQGHGPTQLADQPRAVERAAAGQLGPLDEHDVGPATLGQVVGDGRAADAAADDHRPSLVHLPVRSYLPSPAGPCPRQPSGARRGLGGRPTPHRLRLAGWTTSDPPTAALDGPPARPPGHRVRGRASSCCSAARRWSASSARPGPQRAGHPGRARAVAGGFGSGPLDPSGTPSASPAPTALVDANGNPILIGAGDIADCAIGRRRSHRGPARRPARHHLHGRRQRVPDGHGRVVRGVLRPVPGAAILPGPDRRPATTIARARAWTATSPTSAPPGPARTARPGTRTTWAPGTSSCSTPTAPTWVAAIRTHPRAAGWPPISRPPARAAPWPSGTTRASAPATSTATIRRWIRCGGRCMPPARMWWSTATTTTTSGSRRRTPTATRIAARAARVRGRDRRHGAARVQRPGTQQRVARHRCRHGLLEFTLRDGGYDWRFIADRGDFSDRGTASCH